MTHPDLRSWTREALEAEVIRLRQKVQDFEMLLRSYVQEYDRWARDPDGDYALLIILAGRYWRECWDVLGRPRIPTHPADFGLCEHVMRTPLGSVLANEQDLGVGAERLGTKK